MRKRVAKPVKTLEELLTDAIKALDPEEVRGLIRRGARVLNASPGFDGHLCLAINSPTIHPQNKLEVIRLLLKHGADPMDENCSGTSPIVCAIQCEAAVDVCKVLLECVKGGVSYDALLRRNLCLIRSVAKGDVSLVRLFLQYGANPLDENKKGNTSIDFALKLVSVNKSFSEREQAVEILNELLSRATQPTCTHPTTGSRVCLKECLLELGLFDMLQNY